MMILVNIIFTYELINSRRNMYLLVNVHSVFI